MAHGVYSSTFPLFRLIPHPRQPSPSGDTLKLATLPSRFATETTHRHTRLNAAPFSFHWPPIGYSFVARRSRCGGASFQPSVLGKVSRHETFTKSHENSTGSEPCCFFVIFRVGFVSHRLAETRRVKCAGSPLRPIFNPQSEIML